MSKDKINKILNGIVTYAQIKGKVIILRIKNKTWIYCIVKDKIKQSANLYIGAKITLNNLEERKIKNRKVYITKGIPSIRANWNENLEKELKRQKKLHQIKDPLERKFIYLLKQCGKNKLADMLSQNTRARKEYLRNLWHLYETKKLDFYSTISLLTTLTGLTASQKLIDMTIKHYAEELYEQCCNAFEKTPQNCVTLSTFLHNVKGYLLSHGIIIKNEEIEKRINISKYVKIDHEGNEKEPLIYPSEIYRYKKEVIQHFLEETNLRPKKNYNNLEEAIKNHKYIILTGPPGSGKTYSVKQLEKKGLKIIYTATTGKAAALLPNGRTLHSLLGWDGKNFNVDPQKLNCNIIVVDESSMLNWPILNVLVKKTWCKLIFAGDPNQLPPVKGEYVFKKIFKYLPVVELKEVKRGKMNVQIIKRKTSSQALTTIKALISDFIRKKVSWQVISPVYHGILGVENLNKELKKFLKQKGLKTNKVMLTKNFYFDNKLEASNGEFAKVIAKDFDGSCLVRLNNGSIIQVSKHEIEDAYCISVHKSQGSEYDYVIYCCPLSEDKISKELEYVAITRSKKKTFVIQLTQ